MRLPCYIWIVSLVACRIASADPTNATTESTFPGCDWVDETHSNLEKRILRTATWLDTRFGDRSVMTGKTAACTAMIGAEVLIDKGGSVSVNARGRANLDLPRVEHRLRLFADNFRHNLLPGVDPIGTRDEIKVGTRWRVFETVRSLFDLDVGVRRFPPEPFVNLWYGYSRKLCGWGFQFDQTEFWTVDDHLGELSVVTWTHPLGRRCLFRSVTAAKWAQESEGLETEQTLGVAVQFAGGRRQLDLSGSVFAQRNDIVNYRLSVGWRARWLRSWNTVYIVPVLEFPEEEDFHAHPSLRVGIETAYW